VTVEDRHSVYCFASDVLDEGAAPVLDNVQSRAGVSSVTIAVKYHAVTDVYPHNPARKLATLPPGVFYRPDPARYQSAALRPLPSPLARGRDVLEEACAAAEMRGMSVSAWVVLLHHDEAQEGAPGLQVNCFGDEIAGALCPADPDVCLFAEQLVAEVASYPVRTVRLESLHFQGVGHGHHHERLLERYGGAGLFILGLCFCRSCTQRAEDEGIDAQRLAASARCSLQKLFDGRMPAAILSTDAVAEMCGEEALAYQEVRKRTVTSLAARLGEVARREGRRLFVIDQTVAVQSYASGSRTGRAEGPAWDFALDLGGLKASGAKVEVTGYLADPAELYDVLAWYQDAAGGDLAVVLRPGPPDNASTEQLQAKLAAASAVGAAEVNFYAYGLYRLDALDRIGAALATPPGAPS
jgi:hypothetical protein